MKKKKGEGRQRFEVIEGGGRRFNFRAMGQATLFYALLLLALVAVAQFGYHWLGEQFLTWRLRITPAVEGVMEQSFPGEGLVLRAEEVIASPAEGLVLQLAPAGERYPARTELARIGLITSDQRSILEGEDRRRAQQLLVELEESWRVQTPRETVPDHEETDDELEETLAPEGEEEEEQEEQEEGVFSLENNYAGRVPEEEQSASEGTIIVRSPRPGLFSHYTDGWEGRSGPLYLEGDAFERVRPRGTYTAVGDLVRIGSPLGKIVDNWRWRYSLVLPLHEGRVLVDYPRLEIEFAFSPGETVPARLESYERDDSRRLMSLTYILERQVIGFEQARWTEATLLFRRREGIIVPEEALFEKEGRRGVYLNQGGRVVFQPVKILDRQDALALVEGLNAGQMIINRPDLVEEGQRLN